MPLRKNKIIEFKCEKDSRIGENLWYHFFIYEFCYFNKAIVFFNWISRAFGRTRWSAPTEYRGWRQTRASAAQVMIEFCYKLGTMNRAPTKKFKIIELILRVGSKAGLQVPLIKLTYSCSKRHR